jgi:ribosomal subunit interface protein
MTARHLLFEVDARDAVLRDLEEDHMEKPVQIAFHGITPSDDITREVEERARKLERYFDRIVGCKVAIECPSRRHHRGKHIRVRVELTVPGKKLVVGRDPVQSTLHEDLGSALDSAFREARRQLEDHARRHDHRARPTARSEPARARVARLFRKEGYGFLVTPDGREVFFDARSVLGSGFARMRVGSPVRYAEEMGEEGPQASTIEVGRRAK